MGIRERGWELVTGGLGVEIEAPNDEGQVMLKQGDDLILFSVSDLTEIAELFIKIAAEHQS